MKTLAQSRTSSLDTTTTPTPTGSVKSTTTPVTPLSATDEEEDGEGYVTAHDDDDDVEQGDILDTPNPNSNPATTAATSASSTPTAMHTFPAIPPNTSGSEQSTTTPPKTSPGLRGLMGRLKM
jgi:hypothetical protein